MSISLYDLLDVEEDATQEQIRVAWKVAIADLDPTDRRFRAFNDAARVLLDADKRREYDAKLAAERAEVEDEISADAESSVPAASLPDGSSADGSSPDGSSPNESLPNEGSRAERSDVSSDQPGDDDRSEVPAPVAVGGAAAVGPPTWSLVVAGVAAVVSLSVAIVVLSWPGSLGGTSPADRVDRAERAERAGMTAVDSAAAAVPAVLSYDYRTLDADFAEAEEFLTEEFAAKRSELFDQQADSGLTLREQVVADEVVVTARVAGTGLTRVSEDGGRASVVVFVDQDSQKGEDSPRSLRMWATLSMVADGEDWLVDDICTEDDCS